MFKVVSAAFWRLGYTASFFADVPPFLTWIYHNGLWLAELAAQEPVGTVALVCSIAVAVAVAWTAMKMRPPLL